MHFKQVHRIFCSKGFFYLIDQTKKCTNGYLIESSGRKLRMLFTRSPVTLFETLYDAQMQLQHELFLHLFLMSASLAIRNSDISRNILNIQIIFSFPTDQMNTQEIGKNGNIMGTKEIKLKLQGQRGGRGNYYPSQTIRCLLGKLFNPSCLQVEAPK